MKKYQILIAGLLLSVSCMNETERSEQNNRDFRVTAIIENTDTMSRVADRNDRTTFTEGDAILIGWSGSVSYKYRYSGTNSSFAPDAAADRELWTGLLNTSSAVDVYAWYGTMNSTLPAVGTSIAIPQDQTSESKLLSGICMAAHQSASSTTNTLDFTFHHLTARLYLSVDIVDPTVTQPDVMGATARINHIYADGTIATDASDEYQLSVTNDKAGTQSIRMKQSWSDQQVFHLDFECLLPPQTLGEEQNITITLANGKEYVCSVGSDLTLSAGKKTILNATLKASDSSTFEPKLTAIPDARNSAFSGNRLICIINAGNGEYRYRVYDKQPDGSWGEGVPVYEDEEGTIEFPTKTYSSILRTGADVGISGDYIVIAADNGNNNNSTYFIKKSKNTGKWYCANGRIQGHGYSVCISEDFLVSGNHVSTGSYANRSYIYPIDENGNLGTVQDTPSGISAYKSSIYGSVLATDSGVYEYDPNQKKWVKLFGYVVGDNQRVATDGKRVIMQEGTGDSDVHIYNVATRQEEGWDGPKARAAVGKPVAIYGDYALAGTATKLSICYRNPATGKWSIINPDGGFLEMMKKWDKSIIITEINGQNITMKGTRAMIAGTEMGSIFIENIDKMVEDYLANPY